MKPLYPLIRLLFVLALSGPRLARGQSPANDDPCGAVVLTPQGAICTAPSVGTTQGATATPPNGYQNTNQGCGQGQPAPALDVWYQFTRGTSQLSFGATITVTGNAAGRIRLFSATSCAGPFTEIGCSSAANGNTAAPALVTSPNALVVPNASYYIAVTAYGGIGLGGPFTICVNDGSGFVPCQNPVVGPPVYSSAAHTAATFSFTPAYNNIGPFTAQLGDVNGTGGPLQTVTVNPPAFTLTGLVPGTSYDVSVTATCATGGSVYGTVRFVPPPPNDEPCTAQALLLDPGTGCLPVPGATRGATTTLPNGYANPGCAGTAMPHDVWYSLTTAAGGPGSISAVFTVSNTPAARQLRLFAAPSCAGPFAELACADSAGRRLGAAPLVATGLVPNTTYYLSVAEGPVQGTAVGLFTICGSALPPALPCSAPARLDVEPGLLGSTTAVLNIVPVPGSPPPVSYTLVCAPSAGGSPLTLTVPYRLAPDLSGRLYTAALLTGLLPGTAYAVSVVANCVGGGLSVSTGTTFTTLPAGSSVPPNDFCSNAVPLLPNTTCVVTNSSTLNATTFDPTAGYALNNPCSVYQGFDVWFSVAVPPSGIVAVATGPVSGSPVTFLGITLYAGPCNRLRQVGCNGVGFSQVRGSGLVPGSTVYARVWGFSGGGPFTVCATTDPTCPPVTNLTIAALTSTSASLAFTLPGGANTSYALTYTPAGGMPQTQVVTASPVVLNGLLPGTTYSVNLTSTCSGGVPAAVNTTFTTPPIPACTPPGMVYVGNLTATSAGVGFVLNPLASGYTLTYQAAGGVIQTLSLTGSPAALTGLTPGLLYTVCVSSSCPNGLVSAPACATAFRTPLAARNATAAAQLTLHPNPAQRTTTLAMPTALLQQATMLTLTDALGRNVHQQWLTPAHAAETRTQLELTGLPSGVYVLRLICSTGPVAKRLVID